MGTIRIVRDPHNTSHSRHKAFLGCPYRSGRESFFQGAKRTATPYWLLGGGAAHFCAAEIQTKTVTQHKLLPKDDVEKEVERAAKFISMVLRGNASPDGSFDPQKRTDVFWSPKEEVERRGEKEMEKYIRKKISEYLRKVLPAIKAIALQCTEPSNFVETHIEKSFDLRLKWSQDPETEISILGRLDRIDQRKDARRIITDYKTGNFAEYRTENLFGNEQMLLYYRGCRQIYGEYPSVAYFVSFNIPVWDVERHGAGALELDQHRVQAVIREDHFEELWKEIDDVWTVLMALAHPDKYPKIKDTFEPKSEKGKRMNIRRNLEEDRLVPIIGRHCGICPERPFCQEDNPEDWEDYRERQALGNVINILPQKEFLAPYQPDLPEEWLNPFALEEEEIPEQMWLGLKKPVQGSALKRYRLSAEEWEALGFFTPERLVAALRKMHDIIPVVTGIQCPCRKTKRVPLFFLKKAAEFILERENYKRTQESEGKTRSGEGKDRVKDLFDSEVVKEILRQCPVEGCPFAKKDEPT